MKATILYEFNPSPETCDEFPGIARYGKTICRASRLPGRPGWVEVICGREVAWCRKSELGKRVGRLFPPTKIQLALMQSIAAGRNRYTQMVDAVKKAGGSADGMAMMNLISKLMDGPLSSGKTTMVVYRTIKFARKMKMKYKKVDRMYRKGDEYISLTMATISVPMPKKGFITRTGKRGEFRYHLTPLGKSFLE